MVIRKSRFAIAFLLACLMLSTILITGVLADEQTPGGVTSSIGVIHAVPPVTSSTAVDAFECDDVPEEAKPIEVDGDAQFHLFGVPGDVDWVSFEAEAGQYYLIATEDLLGDTDPVLALFTADEVPQLLAENDDFAGGKAARLIWQAPETGRYLVRVAEKENRFGINIGYRLFISASESDSDSGLRKVTPPIPPRMRM